MDYDAYLEIIQQINETFGTIAEAEHPNIHEIFEGPNPLFKLLFNAQDDTNPPIMIVSFHLDTPTTAAIQWFLRLKQLDPQVYLTGCYIRDAQGTTYVGDDAEVYRMYVIEQEVITNWLKSNKDEEDILEAEQKLEPSAPAQTFATEQAAIPEFNRTPRKKSDTFH